MIAVIFEFWPDPGHTQDYFDFAGALRAEVEKIDGFLSVERFASVSEEGKFVSLSFWRDEEAVARWRRHLKHREAQAAGRTRIFRDYRLRIAGVMRDYSMEKREEAPKD
jgi:heme-degrading monooxygenase HmoA